MQGPDAQKIALAVVMLLTLGLDSESGSESQRAKSPHIVAVFTDLHRKVLQAVCTVHGNTGARRPTPYTDIHSESLAPCRTTHTFSLHRNAHGYIMIHTR